MPPTPDTLFQIANTTTLAGWLALALFPLAPRPATLVAVVLPILFSTLYAALILAHWAGAEGGYGSLAEVMRLFDFPGMALAGWVHYLAFDMLMGLWIARNARAQGMSHLLVLPILALTFLFGPSGLLAYLILATALRKRSFA
ncbi:MAG: ABA4-like family protein [Gemmobacter sp.]